MPPEYKVHVPEEKSKEFEAIASRLKGVTFKRVGPSREDKEAELNKQLDPLRERIQQILERKNPEIDAAIDDGFVQLIKSVLKPISRSVAERIVTKMLPRLRETVCEMFLECTRISPTKIRKTGIAEWPQNVLKPKQVELQIERFGLVDGKPKTLEALSTMKGMSKQNIGYIINSGLGRIRRKLELDVNYSRQH